MPRSKGRVFIGCLPGARALVTHSSLSIHMMRRKLVPLKRPASEHLGDALSGDTRAVCEYETNGKCCVSQDDIEVRL